MRKVELLCDILEAKKMKCFKGEHNLLCQCFIEVETQSSKYKSSEMATWITTWFLSWDNTCWSENVLGLFAICVLCIIILFPISFLPWELYVSVASEQWFCQFLTYRENRRNWSEVKVAQSCPTLCNPIDGSPPGSPVPGILQARTLEWAAISFSNAWKWKVKVKSLSCVRLLATPWTAAYQAPLSTGFSRQEYWSGVPSPSPQDMWHLFSILLLRRNLDWMSHKSSYSSKILHGSELCGF